MSVRGIIFDYGGTLDCRGDHWSHIIREAWQNAGIDVPLSVFRDCYVYAERYMAAHHVVEANDDFRQLMYRKALLELDELQRIQPEAIALKADEKTDGMDAAIRRRAEIVADYCDAHARACIDKVRPLLETLASRVPLVLVSNFYGNIVSVLRAYGIRRFFTGVIESAVVGIRKPDPRIFALGLTVLDLPAGDVLVVGDSLKKDILPARKLGCRTAWIKGRGWSEADDEATDPSQIATLSDVTSFLQES